MIELNAAAIIAISVNVITEVGIVVTNRVNICHLRDEIAEIKASISKMQDVITKLRIKVGE